MFCHFFCLYPYRTRAIRVCKDKRKGQVRKAKHLSYSQMKLNGDLLSGMMWIASLAACMVTELSHSIVGSRCSPKCDHCSRISHSSVKTNGWLKTDLLITLQKQLYNKGLVMLPATAGSATTTTLLRIRRVTACKTDGIQAYPNYPNLGNSWACARFSPPQKMG